MQKKTPLPEGRESFVLAPRLRGYVIVPYRNLNNSYRYTAGCIVLTSNTCWRSNKMRRCTQHSSHIHTILCGGRTRLLLEVLASYLTIFEVVNYLHLLIYTSHCWFYFIPWYILFELLGIYHQWNTSIILHQHYKS